MQIETLRFARPVFVPRTLCVALLTSSLLTAIVSLTSSIWLLFFNINVAGRRCAKHTPAATLQGFVRGVTVEGIQAKDHKES